ncbi:MAG: DUF3343 domain-containing protein [Firmicutes bacterium]|nr:DUF3343 domain-containing protein [Bacillota bacterium]
MRCIYRFPSITYAERVSRALTKESILHKITELNPKLSEKGCAYGIEIPCYEYGNVNNILSRLRVRYEYIML